MSLEARVLRLEKNAAAVLQRHGNGQDPGLEIHGLLQRVCYPLPGRNCGPLRSNRPTTPGIECLTFRTV